MSFTGVIIHMVESGIRVKIRLVGVLDYLFRI